jgi:hypothetical protein
VSSILDVEVSRKGRSVRGSRLSIIVIAVAVIVSACADASSEDPTEVETPLSPVTSPTDPAESNSTTSGDTPAAAAFPSGPSALEDPRADAFPDPLVDPAEIISGGPPPDGIPPIDHPAFLPVADNLEILPANEPVVALEIDGDARAYPIRAMVWHEIVNDTVGGIPVSVTYCPLCNSAATYERVIDGNVTTFGTSGRLYASALVMYDRATESLWTHFNGEAIVGLLTGTRLTEYPSPLLSWGDFRQAYPAGLVLDWTQTGFDRDYGRNPYTGYDDPTDAPFLFRGALDGRARAMQRVVGVEIDGSSTAFALEAVRGGERKATNTDVGGTPIVIFWKSGQASALDRGTIDGGRDVGSVGVFLPDVDGRTLTFEAGGAGYIDLETESTWSITGEALDGPFSGGQLVRVPHLDTFWFAWSTYRPGTDLVGG